VASHDSRTSTLFSPLPAGEGLGVRVTPYVSRTLKSPRCCDRACGTIRRAMQYPHPSPLPEGEGGLPEIFRRNCSRLTPMGAGGEGDASPGPDAEATQGLGHRSAARSHVQYNVLTFSLSLREREKCAGRAPIRVAARRSGRKGRATDAPSPRITISHFA
jgi:hypothetical protein